MPVTNVITAIVTAYCSCKICCGPNAKGIAANGHKPTPNYTVAASRSIPFGSKVLFDKKTFVVEDRLAKRYDSRIDVFFNTHEEAKKFGKQTKQVTIITK